MASALVGPPTVNTVVSGPPRGFYGVNATERETSPKTPLAPSRSACAVKLPTFEGPLDLLLHLIRANEVDIHDIPIALISEQYLEYLDLMHQIDVDVAADYLLMAATLAHIKSRMLVPPDPDAEDELGEDPRAELARRLAEYALFKEAAIDLNQRPQLGRDVFTAEPDLSMIEEKEPVLSVSLFAMLEAMRRVLAKLPEQAVHHQVALERMTLTERMTAVLDRMRGTDEAILFEDLLLDGEPSRHRVVMTFLAILELARTQIIRIFQNVTERGAPSGPVRVHLAVQPDGAGAGTP